MSRGKVLTSQEIHLGMVRSSLFTLPWGALSSGRDMNEAQLLQDLLSFVVNEGAPHIQYRRKGQEGWS